MTENANPFIPLNEAVAEFIEAFNRTLPQDQEPEHKPQTGPAPIILAAKRLMDACSEETFTQALDSFTAIAEEQTGIIRDIERQTREDNLTTAQFAFLTQLAKYRSTIVYAAYATRIAGESMFATLKVMPLEMLTLLEIDRREKRIKRIFAPVVGLVAGGVLYPLVGIPAVYATILTAVAGYGAMTLFSASGSYLKNTLGPNRVALLKYSENCQYIIDVFQNAHNALTETLEGDAPLEELRKSIAPDAEPEHLELHKALALLTGRHDIMFRFLSRMISVASMAADSGRREEIVRIFTPEIIQAIKPERPGYPKSTSPN